MTGIESIQVVFSLPEWATDERFDKEVVLRYSCGHAWAGQVMGYRNDNIISCGLLEMKFPASDTEVSEVSLDPMNPTVMVIFGCDLDDLPVQTKAFQRRLELFLSNIKKENLA